MLDNAAIAELLILEANDWEGHREQALRRAAHAEVFRALWPFTRAARIAKRRYNIPSGGPTIEMDVYQGSRSGLMTAEIEFSSRRESRSFQPPDWFGREVTANPRYSNVQLARRGSVPRDRNQK